MSYEYPRFKEWADKNYPAENYFSAEDRLSEIETRMNSDGRNMPEKLRQSLLEDFQIDYDPVLREMQKRAEEKLEIARFLGNGEIPKSMSDEVIESLQRPEIMDIDLSSFRTDRENVYPPEKPIMERRQSGFGAITSSVKGFFRRILGR